MFQDGFPQFLREDVTKVIGLISNKTYNNVKIGVSEEVIHYVQDKNIISFPYRIYHIDNTDKIIDKLSLQQKSILHCIYSRSCDGFVRQKHIYSLLQMDYEYWAIPYIVKVCDEYVVEILEMTYNHLKDKDKEPFKKFCLENAESFCKSYQRMISYWNEYYRAKYENYHSYIGRKLFRDCFGYSKSIQAVETGTLAPRIFP